jgi:decaprenylphospho-beta-D-ribofuranose 2-oxidase
MSEPEWHPLELSGWGRSGRARTLACRPPTPEAAVAALAAAKEPVIVHGGGRSYGDAALNDGGRTILTAALDRIEAFAPDGGLIVCQPGVTFDMLLERFLPEGWLFPVSPGTAFTTLGGALANDIHGKNHEIDGSFGDHVRWLDLALPGGEVRRITPASEPALFRATVGGIGLTGLILRLAFAMRRVPSASVVVTEQRLRDLDAFMAALEACRRQASFSVGWIDTTASGRGFGRGILEIAEPAPADARKRTPRRQLSLPFDLPAGVLNPATVRLFNALYWRRVPAGGRTRVVPIERFLYPLDAIGRWNRIYGARGFYQFQAVIPDREAGAGIPALLRAVVAARSASFLAVLKTMGSAGKGFLSFPLPGTTLALDFPRRDDTAALLRRLEEITLAHGGRVYLAKDALLSPEAFRAMYPDLPALRAVLDQIDPERRLASDMSRRLRIREG